MFAQGRNSIFYRDLIQEISEESILEYYTGIVNIPCIINSPFRQDSNPSFSVYYSQSGRIHFKDFGTGEAFSMLSFLMTKLNLDTISKVVDDILSHIDGIKSIDRYAINSERRNVTSRRNTKKTAKSLGVKVREWRDYDLEFWNACGISMRWLEFGSIYPISHIFMGENSFSADKYAYCYVEFKDNRPTYKIYQPYSKERKWLNNHDSSVWDLWAQAMRTDSDDLIITSSRKDALCLWANTGVPSVAFQSESTFPKPHIVSIPKTKFKRIWCLYDNDFDREVNYGREYGKKLSELYSFTQIEIPEFWKSKDPSDLYKNHGSYIFTQVLKQLLNK